MIVGNARIGMELIPSKLGRICVALQTHRQAALGLRRGTNSQFLAANDKTNLFPDALST
jgi:hypothetical protein